MRRRLLEKHSAHRSSRSGYTRCRRCGRPNPYTAKFGMCRICYGDGARGEIPADKGKLGRGETTDDHDRSHRRCSPASGNANKAHFDTVKDARSKRKESWPPSCGRGRHHRFEVNDNADKPERTLEIIMKYARTAPGPS